MTKPRTQTNLNRVVAVVIADTEAVSLELLPDRRCRRAWAARAARLLMKRAPSEYRVRRCISEGRRGGAWFDNPCVDTSPEHVLEVMLIEAVRHENQAREQARDEKGE